MAGIFIPNAHYTSVPSGLSIVASEAIDPDATIVACPFSIIITPLLSKGALQPLLGDVSFLERWTERQLIIVYICFHWIVRTDTVNSSHGTLIHSARSSTALKGTNLYGATIDRRRAWEAEWEQCLADVSTINGVWGEELTWERYLTASTYLSSRAFSSTLLSTSPSLLQTPDSISLVARTAVDGGAEIFNNYGAKPNSELLLGYGFTIPDNPDDYDPRGAESVWDAIMGKVPEWQTARLPNVPVSGALRADIADMIGHYVSGQREVLRDLVEYANRRETDGMVMARREGVVVQLEEEVLDSVADVGYEGVQAGKVPS
ncbi:hypothetical protein H4582DRAFT_1895801 [Lactarius indigo]|nr:hypothetical protein H4582DRAFT_1895801 [Lactarius indigo]